jgi:DNA invertase Pin-like site-specific DNA recombinase
MPEIFKDERTGEPPPSALPCSVASRHGRTATRSSSGKFDRLADFHQRGIHFRSLTEEINTSTPGGKLIFHIFAALAEFERGLIIERTRAGMKAARARGVRPGPKTEVVPAAD